MTNNPSIKRAIRERIKATGEPYVVARRIIIEESNKNNPKITLESNTLPITEPFIKTPKLPNALKGQTTIAVTAASGGVGKTTTAICLAGAIAKVYKKTGKSKKVVVVDLNTSENKVASLLRRYMPTAISIRVMPSHDADSILPNLVYDEELMINALLAPVRPRNAADVDADFYKKVIQVLQTTHDVVILVLPNDYLHPLSKMSFEVSDEILVVTTLATTNVEMMSRALTEFFTSTNVGGLAIQRNKVGIVANMVLANVGMRKEKLLRASLGVPLVGQIPSEYDVILAATNKNRLGELLNHERLGVAYNKLAISCIPSLASNSNISKIYLEIKKLNKIKFKEKTQNMTIEDLDFSEEQKKIYSKYCNMSEGLILVAGNTGQGKSTTLYATLNTIKSNTKKIITIEKPIEVIINGVEQIEVDPRTDLEFHNLMETMNDTNPNVILLSEIRDKDTADFAKRAATMGKLVFSSIHGRDSFSAIDRLNYFSGPQADVQVDVQADPVLKLVIAQSLVRRLCDGCSFWYTPRQKELISINPLWKKGVEWPLVMMAVGCQKCQETGYFGRIALYEMLEIDSDIQELINKGASSQDILRIAVDVNGMSLMRQDGWNKILAGKTTIEEVARVLAYQYPLQLD